jgi:hypothetical protein
MKRGMSSFDISKIPLKFGAYVNRKLLPALPTRFGHVAHDAPHGGWGMLGNDTKGDCTVAGIAHGLMVWRWAVDGEMPPFDERTIVEQYLSLTGGADTGLDPVQVARWWKDSGLVDARGVAHTIRTYTAIDTTQNLAEAAYLFGFAGCGLWLPDNAEDQFSKGEVWDDLTYDPNPGAGHFVPLVGRNSKGNYMVVTWGALQAATPQWLEKYFAGGVAYTSREYMRTSGLSPEGFNFQQLDSDMMSLS